MNEDLGAFESEPFGVEGGSQASLPLAQLQSSRTGAQALPAASDNVVVLAPGQTIARLEADGLDLVIILNDGTRIVVPDGTILVPQLIVDGTPIPAANVAALLIGNEPEPEAGINPSSGGNFAVDPGAIQAAFDLGDLLPYTELPVNLAVEEEIIPFPPTDEEVTIFGLDGEGPEVVLDEDDLATPGDDQGSDQTDPLSVDGSFVVNSPDGLSTVQVNGVNVVVNGAFAGPVEVANDGIYAIVITGWTPVLGTGGRVISATFSYSATLLNNTLDHAATGEDSVVQTLTVTATDRDGSSASASVDVQIIDDVPAAANDTDSIAAGSFGPAVGNVITDAEGDGGADTSGADGITVTAVGAGEGALSALTNGSLVINGTYGVLTINANGSYSYTRNFNTPGGVSDVFTYRVTDGDGDTVTATLTIAIEDAQDTITFVPETGDGTVVREPHLPEREDEPAGSDFDGNPEATTGTITFRSPDGVQSVTLGGVVITPNALPQTISSDETGTLIVTGYIYDPVTGEGSVTYTYTLNDNTLDPDGTDVPVDIVVTDLDGDVASDTVVISIIDDVPTAADDVDSLTEGGPVFASGNVITDAEGNGGADVTGADGGVVETPGSFAGTYGTLELGADGTYTYTLSAFGISQLATLGDGEFFTEVFDYVLIDGDGDVSPASLTITLNGADDGVTINGLDGMAPEVVLDEDDLATPGDDQGSDQMDPLSVGGSFGVVAPDGLASVVINMVNVVSGGAFVGPVTVINNGIYTVAITGWTPVFAADGVTVISATFTYSATLLDNTLGHSLPGEDAILAGLNVTATDSDGSGDSAILDVRIIDDVVSAIGGASVGTVDEDGLFGGIAGGTGDVPGAALTAMGSVAGLFNFGADGVGSYSLVSSSQVQAALAAQDLSSGGVDLVYTVVGNTITATRGAGGANIFTFTLDAGNGAWNFTLSGPLDHAPGANENDLSIEFGSLIQAIDRDGDIAVATGSLTVTIDDDMPVPVTPASANMADAAGATGVFSLDTVNGNVDDNLGADGRGGAIFTAATVAALTSQNLTSGLAPLTYTIEAEGTTLIARKSTDGTEVFRITLEPDGFEDQYVVQISQPVDSVTNVDFNDGGYNFVGGNGSWAGFTQPGDNDSNDLLLTPVGGGTVNTNANEGGIASGNSVGSGEAMRVDYVVDLTGSPVPGGDFYDGDDTQNFDGHYTTNGGSALFTAINTSSTVRISAFDDNDSGTVRNVGDGTTDVITRIAISFNGQTSSITASGTYTVGGRSFTVTFNGGVVDVAGVGDNTRIAAFTADGYNSIEWRWLGGETFKIGDFGGTVVTDDPVSFFVPVSVSDGDGDIVSSGNLNITLNPVEPLIVLDLDGDGAEFVGTEAGVMYDLNGDGIAEATAWAGAGDGILVRDANGNNQVDGAAEIVFGNTLGDALAALSVFDTAGIAGALDPADPVWTTLRVWQDANQNGVVNTGELRTLASLGITSISTSDDNVRYSDVNGEVVVQGTGSFTASGSGALAAGTYDIANALVDPVVFSDGTGGAANMIGVAMLPNRSQVDVSSLLEQRLSLVAMNHAALAGLLAGLPVAAAAHSDLGQFVNARVANDFSGLDFGESMSLPARAGLVGFEGAMLLGENAAPRAWVDLAASRSISDAGAQLQHNPLEIAGDVSGAPSAPAWAAEEFSPAAPVFFNGSQAGDPGLMEALLLGGDNVALPAAADLGSGDQVPADMMDALLLVGADNAPMPALVDLAGSALAQQTVVDALAGNLVDHLIDQVIGGSEMAGPAPIAAKPEFLIDMLSFDLTGSAHVSGPFQDSAPLDDAAQLALING